MIYIIEQVKEAIHFCILGKKMIISCTVCLLGFKTAWTCMKSSSSSMTEEIEEKQDHIILKC